MQLLGRGRADETGDDVDVRDPERPVEVGYVDDPLVDRDAGDAQGAYALSSPAFVPERREVWYSAGNTGLWVTRLSAKAWPKP